MTTQHTFDEYLDLVDDNDIVIGKKLRSEIYAEHLSNFRAVNCFIVNSKGELWIPRRSPNKKIFPLALDMSMGGHVESGEDYDTAFMREVLEELNLNTNTLPVRVLGHLTPQWDGVSCFMKCYEITMETTPHYNTDDFVESYWMTPTEFWNRVADGEKVKDDLPKLIQRFYL